MFQRSWVQTPTGDIYEVKFIFNHDSFFRRHDLFHAIVEDKIVNLMDLDVKDALKLFLEHTDKLPPETIVEKLCHSSRYRC